MNNDSKRLDFTPLKNTSVVDSFKNWIVDQLISGNLKPGGKLPTEAELCNNLGISRNSIREAIKQLEAYGVVYIKRAEGTFVADSYSPRMLSPLLYSFILQNSNWEDFVDLRRATDIGILHVIMLKEKTPEDLQHLEDALHYLEYSVRQENLDADSIMQADCEFHNIIVEMSKNPQLITLSDYINQITVPSRKTTTINVINNGDIKEYATLHRQLYELIRDNDSANIEKTVFNHYIFWQTPVN